MNEPIQAGSLPAYTAAYPIAVFNASGETAPPYAALQISGSTLVGTDRVFTVNKPTGSSTAKVVLNGPQAIPVAGYGSATDQYPADALYTGSPAFGAEWGPVAASWALSVNGKGFTILGGAAGGIVRVAAKGGTTAGDDFPLVKIRNDSGLPRSLGSIVGYGPPLTQPPNPPRVPTFASTTPTAGKPFVVLLNDINATEIGDAGPLGVLPVQLDFTAAGHLKADCVTGSYANLKSGDSGPATILWREKQHISGAGSLGLQWAFVLLDREEKPEAIRGIVYSTISAATGIQSGNQTPGVGSVKFYDPPTGAIGSPWTLQSQPVQVENWMHGTVAVNKPVLLRLSRTDSSGNKIYEVVSEGCAIIPDSEGGTG